MKKAISLLLAILLIFSTTPFFNVFASDEITNNFCYSPISDTTATLTVYEYEWLVDSIEIPSVINGYTITAIDREVFCRINGVQRITIPNTVNSIGRYCFAYCDNLTDITIPDSVTTIGDNILFGSCYYNDERNWENNLLYVGNHLVAKSTGTEDYIPPQIEGNLTIKDGTKTIAYGVFSGENKITSLTLPKSISSINESAFADCTSLTDIYYKGTEKEWENVLIAYDNNVFGTATIHFLGVEIEKGDANCDGILDFNDYAILCAVASTAKNITDEMIVNCDLNKDLVIDAFDAIELDVKLNA